MSGRSSFFTDDEDDDQDDFDLELGDDDEVEDEEESEESDEKETPDVSQLAQQVEILQQRLGGFQGALQKSQEEKQQMQMQFLGERAKSRYAELIAGGVDEATAQTQIRAELTEVVLQIQGNNINTEKQALEETSRIITAHALATKHGIPTDSEEFKRLSLVKDPEDMAEMAQLIAAKKRTAQRGKQKAQRTRDGADRFGSARPAAAPKKKKASSLDEAADMFISARLRR